MNAQLLVVVTGTPHHTQLATTVILLRRRIAVWYGSAGMVGVHRVQR